MSDEEARVSYLQESLDFERNNFQNYVDYLEDRIKETLPGYRLDRETWTIVRIDTTPSKESRLKLTTADNIKESEYNWLLNTTVKSVRSVTTHR